MPAARLALEALDDRITPAPLTPDEVRGAYGFDRIPAFAGGITADGAGQTIAIIVAGNNPNVAADTAVFNATYGTPQNKLNARPVSGPNGFLRVVNQAGGTTPPANAAADLEHVIDVQWAHAIAPLADIVLVQCNNYGAGTRAGVQWALANGATVISNSYGGPENGNSPSFDGTYRNGGSTGVAVLFASGDNSIVAYPSASANVLSVGATALTVGAGNTHAGESAWSFNPAGAQNNRGSGGGASQFVARPVYQDGVAGVVGGGRGTPDVAAVGAPGSTLSVYSTFNGGAGFVGVFGTSVSCPIWAGLVALVDQGRAAAGLGPYNTSAGPGLMNYQLQTNLYALAANPTTYAADFRDLTGGTNSYGDTGRVGYDLLTGLGSPVADRLVPDLVGYTRTTLTAPPAGAPLTFAAAVTGPSAVPTGAVRFRAGDTVLGTAPLVGGTATLRLAANPLPGRTAAVTAEYLGDLNYPGSSGAATVTFPAAPGRVGFPLFAVGADAGGPAAVLTFRADGTPVGSADPFPGTTNGVRTAVGDVTGDGTPDLIAGTGPGAAAEVKVVDGRTGAVLLDVFPFADFAGGVFVAAGDVTGDGVDDVVVTPDQSGGPRVTVLRGGDFATVADFFGIDDPDFRGGARAAVGDMTGDGFADLVVSAGFGGGPRVSFYDGAALAAGRRTRPTADFFLFEEGLRNGCYVALGDVDGDGFADLIGGAGPGGGPRVLVLAGPDVLAGKATGARAVANFFAGNADNRGGVRVAVADLDGDRRADLVTGDGEGAGSRVTGYRGAGFPAGAAAFAFDAFDGSAAGVFVG